LYLPEVFRNRLKTGRSLETGVSIGRSQAVVRKSGEGS
jgi:hypothetical protein